MRTCIFSYGLFSTRKEWLKAGDDCLGGEGGAEIGSMGESEHVIS